MTTTPKALVDGTLLTASEVTLYTATGVTAAIHSITYTNTDTVDRAVTIWIIPSGQTSGARYRIATAMVIPAGRTVIDDTLRNLESGDFIAGLADSTNLVAIRVDGAEIT
mgnify:CR=1 FL=1